MSVKSSETVQAAINVLKGHGAPLHYEELTNKMIGSGEWSTTGKTKPSYTVYAHLHAYVSRTPDPQIKFFGRGVYGLITHEGEAKVANSKHQYQGRTIINRPLAVIDANRTCGTCLFIEFADVNALTRSVGSCAKSECSGRDYVRSAESPCEHWRKRSRAKIQADQTREQELQVLVQAVSACSHRGAMWDGKDLGRLTGRTSRKGKSAK